MSQPRTGCGCTSTRPTPGPPPRSRVCSVTSTAGSGPTRSSSNPHKWLFTPIDCSVLYVRDPGALRAAFSYTPAFLETGEEGVLHNMDHGLALGRRFRALKLWFVMRYFGQDGLRAILEHHLRLARLLAGLVDAAPGWERWRPSPFSLVVLRHSPPGVPAGERDPGNIAIMNRVNAGGTAFVSHTEVDGETWLRCAIGNIHTMEEHVRAAWRALQEAAEAVSRDRELRTY